MLKFFLVRLTYLFIIFLPVSVFASAFQIWEQDGASIGNFHAGYAASANDASTAFYNPAGITRFKNQQLVLSGAVVNSNVRYRGTVAVNTLGNEPVLVSAQGGTFNVIPAFHYVAPLSERLGFGLSVSVPFGSKINYGRDTNLRYATVLNSVSVVDISPSLGLKVADNLSVGIGFDVQRMSAEFTQVGTILSPEFDSFAKNKATDTGYGIHAGFLYEFNANTRAGVSYHSQVVHHLAGPSSFSGPVADMINNNQAITGRSHANVTLPPYTAFSIYHRPCSRLAVMASAIYTQWNILKNLILNDVSGVADGEPSYLQVVVPEYFHNGWSLSVGADYTLTDTVTLRGGLGYDESPIDNRYRNPQLPDNDRYAVALGAHWQMLKTVGLDASWAHIFLDKASVFPPAQQSGDEVVTVAGHARGFANVYALQVTWDIV